MSNETVNNLSGNYDFSTTANLAFNSDYGYFLRLTLTFETQTGSLKIGSPYLITNE